MATSRARNGTRANQPHPSVGTGRPKGRSAVGPAPGERGAPAPGAPLVCGAGSAGVVDPGGGGGGGGTGRDTVVVRSGPDVMRSSAAGAAGSPRPAWCGGGAGAGGVRCGFGGGGGPGGGGRGRWDRSGPRRRTVGAGRHEVVGGWRSR